MENVPVLEPPPGFEDPPAAENIYDNPPNENDEHVSAFREVSGSGITTKLRPRKPAPNVDDVYSLPVDSVMNRKLASNYRHSMSGPWRGMNEPIHMSLEEVRQYLREIHNSDTNFRTDRAKSIQSGDQVSKRSRRTLSSGFKQVLSNVFRIPQFHHSTEHDENKICTTSWTFSAPNISKLSKDCSLEGHRALPPIPLEEVSFIPVKDERVVDSIFDKPSSPAVSFKLRELPEDLGASKTSLDVAASIDEVKSYGWYWGPLPGEVAEKILANEPDGSFLVRDSSDDRYIFSLSFKLNGGVRHVRIEHDQGNFSFGSVTKFRSQTMVEFIEQAIEHSRSGRFLFFLHRRPTIGPTRVQLINPLSRFRHVQSLQHLCRFTILRLIRRDQTDLLPLPARLKEYLNTAHYYLENV